MPDGVANGLAKRLAALRRHALREGHSRHATRLRDEHGALGTHARLDARLEHVLRHLRGLAAAGLAADDDHLLARDGREHCCARVESRQRRADRMEALVRVGGLESLMLSQQALTLALLRGGHFRLTAARIGAAQLRTPRRLVGAAAAAARRSLVRCYGRRAQRRLRQQRRQLLHLVARETDALCTRRWLLLTDVVSVAKRAKIEGLPVLVSLLHLSLGCRRIVLSRCSVARLATLFADILPLLPAAAAVATTPATVAAAHVRASFPRYRAANLHE